jgi:hypothetical protein
MEPRTRFGARPVSREWRRGRRRGAGRSYGSKPFLKITSDTGTVTA